MKTNILKEEWYYEFTEVSSFSPNGHFVVKSSKVGRPLCVIPMPIGGIDAYAKQEEVARLISATPMLLKACAKITESEFGTAPSVGYMDEMKLRCQLAIKSAIEGDEVIENSNMLTKQEFIAVEFCRWYQFNGYRFSSFESNFETFLRLQINKTEKQS